MEGPTKSYETPMRRHEVLSYRGTDYLSREWGDSRRVLIGAHLLTCLKIELSVFRGHLEFNLRTKNLILYTEVVIHIWFPCNLITIIEMFTQQLLNLYQTYCILYCLCHLSYTITLTSLGSPINRVCGGLQCHE